jgi:hypothetical protein
MSDSFRFEPDPQRAVGLDAGMRNELASSISYLADAADGVVAFDKRAIRDLVMSLERGTRYSPFLFATYYELAEALIEEDGSAAAALFARFKEFAPIEERFRIGALGEGPSGNYADRYVAMMCADPSIDLSFLPPDPDKATAFAEKVKAAMALLDRAAPTLSQEIRGIVDEVVIVSGDKTKKMQFDGGSHYQLWGALFLNCDFHPNVIAAAEVLAHESAHSFLFGCCRDEMLVENDDDETFVSPLRPDPRPMDGIYHATFVSARMHWTMSELIKSGLLNDEDRTFAEHARAGDAANFASGLDVVEKHGKLTRTGAALMSAAKRYMNDAARAAS